MTHPNSLAFCRIFQSEQKHKNKLYSQLGFKTLFEQIKAKIFKNIGKKELNLMRKTENKTKKKLFLYYTTKYAIEAKKIDCAKMRICKNY